MSKKLQNQIIIGVFNNKGGVGKSTTVNSVASKLAQDGYQTLIIDADSQSHQSKYFDQKNLPAGKLEDYIINQTKITTDNIQSDIPNLYLLSNKKEITSSTFASFDALDRNYAIKNIIPDNEFDFILLDLPPTLDLPAINCLLACDYVLSPVEYSELSKDGLLNLVGAIKKIQSHNTNLQFLGCFGSRVNNSFKNTQEFRAFYQEYPDIFFKSEISQNQSFTNLPKINQNIFQGSDIAARIQITTLVDEIKSKIIKLQSK